MVKKGIVFSTIAILLVLFFIFIFSTVYTEYSESSTEFYNIKAKAIGNYYEKILDYYVPIILSNAGHSALVVMVNFTGANRSYIPEENFTEVYQSLMMNGTFNCNFDGLSPGCLWSDSYLQENGLDVWLLNFSVNNSDAINTLSEKTHLFTEDDVLILSINSSTINIYHDSPWTVVVEAYVSVNFSSPQFSIDDIARKVEVKFPLTNLRNPSYLVNSENTLDILYQNTSEIYNYWDFDLLKDAIKSHKFYANNNGPDFLMRLQGLTHGSEFGTISFIDPVWVNTTGFLSRFRPYTRRSFTDPAFFELSDCDTTDDSLEYLYNVSGISSDSGYDGFRLDFNTTVKYLGIDFSPSIIDVVCGS